MDPGTAVGERRLEWTSAASAPANVTEFAGNGFCFCKVKAYKTANRHILKTDVKEWSIIRGRATQSQGLKGMPLLIRRPYHLALTSCEARWLFGETCFGSNKSFAVSTVCNPFLWQQRGLCLACTLSRGKDGLKGERDRTGLNAARCPSSAASLWRGREGGFLHLHLWIFFHPPGHRSLLPGQADIMESHAANLCWSRGRDPAVD